MRSFSRAHEHDIEQAITDAAFDIWQRIDAYTPARGSLRGLLMTSARHNLIALLRAEKASPILQLLDHGTLDRFESTVPARESRSTRVKRLLETLTDCIARLSPMQQDILLTDLAEHERVDDKEIANRWSTNANSISTSRHKGRQRLGKLMRRATE
jgi:DNA-directed RNA polymerase specialized sigma24 family protein